MTREEFLKDYWGSDWDKIREEAIASGIDLELAVTPPPPWEEIELEVSEKFQFGPSDSKALAVAYLGGIPEPLTADWLVANFDTENLTIDDRLLADAQDVVSEHSEEVDGAFELLETELKFAMREVWDTKRFQRGPLFLPAGKRVPMCKAGSFAYKGWCINYVVSTEEFPQLVTMGQDLTLAVHKRDKALTDFLASQH